MFWFKVFKGGDLLGGSFPTIGNYLTSTFFLIIILVLFIVRANSHFDASGNRRRIIMLISATIFYVLMDGVFIACDLDDNCSAKVFRIVVFFFYLSYIFLPFFWHLFLRSYIGIDYGITFKIVEMIPLAVLLRFALLSPFDGSLWTIEADKTYVRGTYFTFFTVLNYFYYVEPICDGIAAWIKGNRKNEKYVVQGIVISLLPILAAIGNNFFIPVYQIYPFQPCCQVIVVILGFFFVANRQDVYARHEHAAELEEAYKEAEIARNKAEEASAVKTTFLSTVSHDIRTPMNAIINLTRLARAEDDIEVIKGYLDKVLISSDFLLGLINDILDMSRIEAGKLTLNKERLTRTEFLKSVETVINPLMEAKHINYHPELQPGEYTIFVDKLRFNQIFFNLLSNAAKFTPEGGDVWFEVTNGELSDDTLEIQFVVRDNGIGMSEGFLEHLFEPFAREDSSEGKKIPGTGLGLSIVKSLVDAMDGTITVTSELGKGTEFVVTFKAEIVEKSDGDVPVAEINANYDLNGLRVLLVEDNELNTYVAMIILSNMGCDVKSVDDGAKAVEAFADSPINYYDAILMDVRMPVMDGLTATRTIRSLDRADARTVPIVAMTADALDENTKDSLDSGMNFHLSKPVDLSKLSDVLNKCAAMPKAK